MKKTITIIEDNLNMRTLLEYVLSKDYKVNSFNNANQALEHLQFGNIPDAIVSDLSLPGMSGGEFIKQLKQNEFLNEIPVLILSATNKSAERIKYFKEGVKDFIIKPFNPQELIARISNILNTTQFNY